MTLLSNTFSRKRKMVLGILFSLFVVANSEQRVDFYDASDNHLLFIIIQNDGNARSVYTSDSTFIKRTVLTKKADGKSEKEVSYNFNQDTIGVTSFAYNGENTEIISKDQFALDQLGGKVNFKESGDNYDVSQNGTTFNKISYEKDGSGNYNKINVTDNNGTLMYYAKITTVGVTTPRQVSKSSNMATLQSKGNNSFELKFKIQDPSAVSCDLYSLSGRNIAKLFNRDYASGNNKETIRIGKNVPAVANGVYLISLTVNGKNVLNEKILMQVSTGGF